MLYARATKLHRVHAGTLQEFVEQHCNGQPPTSASKEEYTGRLITSAGTHCAGTFFTAVCGSINNRTTQLAQHLTSSNIHIHVQSRPTNILGQESCLQPR